MPARRPPDPPAPYRPPWGARLRRHGVRLAVTVAGGAVVLAGVAMLVLPGPGLVTMALGFGLLRREYAWAARLDRATRRRIAAAGRKLVSRPPAPASRPPAPAVRPVASGTWPAESARAVAEGVGEAA